MSESLRRVKSRVTSTASSSNAHGTRTDVEPWRRECDESSPNASHRLKTAGSAVPSKPPMSWLQYPKPENASDRPRPAVLVGLPASPGGLPCVDLDFEGAGRAAIEHLAELGHTTVGVVAHADEFREQGTSFAVRFARGIHDAGNATGLDVTLVGSDGSGGGTHAAVDAILAAAPGTSAFIVHNEPALPHVRAHLAAHGRTVPGDVSVLAVCPADVAERQSTPVTAVEIPAEHLGAAAVDMLVDRIAETRPAEIRLVAPTLVDRGSTRRH